MADQFKKVAFRDKTLNERNSWDEYWRRAGGVVPFMNAIRRVLQLEPIRERGVDTDSRTLEFYRLARDEGNRQVRSERIHGW